MSVSFIRIDDRMIHGQTCTRWAREYPCDGLIAVNDKAAKNDVLKAAYKAASGKKTFVWTLADFEKKSQKVLDSDTRYFLITKNPIDMCKILVDQNFKCGIDTVIVGPCNDREGAVKLGNAKGSEKRKTCIDKRGTGEILYICFFLYTHQCFEICCDNRVSDWGSAWTEMGRL